MATIAKLVVEMSANTQGLRRSLDQAQGRVQKFAQSVRKRANQIGKWLAGAFTVAAGAVALFVRQGLASIDAQAKMARQIGASVDGLRALTEAGEDAGVATAAMEQSIDRFNARLGEARRGSGQAYEALQRLGLSAEALSRMDADERMATLADRVKDLGLDTQQTADVLRQFGIRNREMVNLLTQGGDAIRDSRNEIEEYGLSLNNLPTDAVERANDAWRRVSRIIEVVRIRVALALAPAIEAVAKRFNDASKSASDMGGAVENAVGGIVTSIAFVADAVDGLKRTFNVLRSSIALFALQSQRAMMSLGQSIIDFPVNAVNELIDGLNKISPIKIEPIGITQLSQDLRNELSLIEGAIAEGKKDIQRQMMQPLAGSQLIADIEKATRLQEGKTAGLGVDGGVSTQGIAGAVSFADAMKQSTDAAKDNADETEEQTDQIEKSSRAVRDFGDTAVRAARAIANWGKGAMGTVAGQVPEQDNGLRSVRQRIEAGKDLSSYWLEPNPTASRTWSTSHGAASSAMGASAATARLGQPASGKHLGTLTLASEAGKIDVQANSDRLTSWLADTLSGTAASA